MKILSRLFAIVLFCSMGIALAHLKTENDYLKMKNRRLEYRAKYWEDRNKVLSSAYQSKKLELIKIKEK